MKNLFKIVFFLLVTVMALYGFSKFTGAAIINSTINSSTIGATTPSSAIFTSTQVNSGLLVNAGVNNTGTGFKHVRAASCTTPATNPGTCSTTVTWPTPAFADTNYTLVCTSENSGAYVGGAGSKTTTQFNVNIFNNPPATTAISVTLDCIGVHD